MSTKNRAFNLRDPIRENEGGKVIQALQNYIVPLIQGSSIQENDTYTPLSGLTQEAADLLSALQKFVLSLAKCTHREVDVVGPPTGLVKSVSSPTPRIVSAERPLPKWVIAKEGNKSDSEAIKSISSPDSLLSLSVNQQPILLKRILDKARNRVFNKMPIRMLVFNKDGKEIRLIERSEILRIISHNIEEDFYNDDISTVDPGSDLMGSQNVRSFLARHCAYAILSHTWLRESPGEVTFTDWTTDNFDPQLNGYKKLKMFCQVAAQNHGLTLGWMDTCCIDKTSSAELDESIRSMFRWYKSSSVCVTYLADTMTLRDMHKDTWFTRGWTLQELIAPQMIKFYRRDWKCMASPVDHNDKNNNLILTAIQKATTITETELISPLIQTSVSRRMQWAAARNVTREEDKAYSLMGIFHVSFSTAYGEGSEVAFSRLIHRILSGDQFHSDVLDIVNWGHGNDTSTSLIRGLLPTSPEHYMHAAPHITWHKPHEPVLITPLGLRVSVLIMPAAAVESTRDKRFTPIGDYHATANIRGCFLPGDPGSLGPRTYNEYNVLDARLFDRRGNAAFTRPYYANISSQMQMFGVLNFKESVTAVEITYSQVCFAHVLETATDPSVSNEEAIFSIAAMASPVTFKLQTTYKTYGNIIILKNDLRKHGMLLRTMYL